MWTNIDGDQNPDGELNLGEYQADNIASHSHAVNTDTNAGSIASFDPRYAVVNIQNSSPYQAVGGGISYTGGNETRSKNITVNYFIRIN